MTRSALKTVEKNFVKGRLSEFTGLNFPENSCVDESNCVFDSKGKVYRRTGINAENGASVLNLNEPGATSRFVWKNAGQTANTNILVIQQGSELGFSLVGGDGSVSEDGLDFILDLLQYETGEDLEFKVCAYAFGNGRLFVSNPEMDPIFIDYDEDSGDYTVKRITVQIRDTEGFPDPEMDNRPTTYRPPDPPQITNAHKYNLYNQGWWPRLVFGHNGRLYAPLSGWDIYNENWPSNADIWWSFKFLAGNPTNKEEFVPGPREQALTESGRGNSPAPRGYFILNAFRQDRTFATSQLEAPGDGSRKINLPLITSGGKRPSVIAFFAGRVWYAGVQSPGFSQTIYFSKVIEGEKDYGKCYQVNDPTIEDGTDLLDSDGGTVKILEMGTPIAFFNMRDSLLIICNNGIWAIAGSTGTGFKATDYAIQKVSGVGGLSPLSLVNIEGSPTWWNADGIYGISVNQNTGQLEAQSLTKPTIQTFFNNIPVSSKRYAMGDYNPVEKRVIWMYRSTDFIIPEGEVDIVVEYDAAFDYDRALIFDVTTGAFYTWSFDPGEDEEGEPLVPFNVIRGVLNLESQGAIQNTVDVVVNGDLVVVNGEGVTTIIIFLLDVSSVFKFITRPTGVTFGGLPLNGGLIICELTDDAYIDFESFDPESAGTPYSSFFTTAYKVHADGDKAFNNHWVTVFTEKTGFGENSCMLQGRWDWTLGSFGRWSRKQQCYTSTVYSGGFGRSTYHRRLKLRGSGPALQLNFISVGELPFTISGWSTQESATDTVSR